MSTTTWAWLVLLFPLLGAIVNGLGYKRLGRGGAGCDRHGRDRRSRSSARSAR